MSEPFGDDYAAVYDLIYSDKDYSGECDLIERAFRADAAAPVRLVLDLGCGTGNHAIPLARRGYEVVGVDRSEAMLAEARRKAGSAVTFHRGDVRDVDLGRRFDAVLMMFAVLGYQRENADVLAALATARRHLRPGGLFLYDVWYGPAVLAQRPSQRVKVIPAPDGEVVRIASGELDVRRQLCTVRYEVWRLAGDRLVSRTKETHTARYFFPLELDLFLTCAGFRPLRLGAFPDIEREPDETTWNVFGAAVAAP